MYYQTSGNVHTANFYIKVSPKTQSQILLNNKHLLSNSHKGIQIMKDGFTFIFKKSNYIDIEFDIIEVLRKNNIDEKDSDNILVLLDKCMHELHPFSFESVLKRVDLRYDVVIPTKERAVFWKLMTKASKNIGKLHKKYGDSPSDNSLYYKSMETQTNRETLRINIYDKESQLKSIDGKIADEQKNVIRFEIQLFNKHLNYKKYRYNIEKVLEYYLSERCRIKNFNNYITPIVFSGKHYKLKDAKKIIKSSDKSNHMKIKLIELLVKCSRTSIDETKKNYSLNTWNKYIKSLSSLNINPITIPFESPINNMENLLSYDTNNPIFKVD